MARSRSSSSEVVRPGWRRRALWPSWCTTSCRMSTTQLPVARGSSHPRRPRSCSSRRLLRRGPRLRGEATAAPGSRAPTRGLRHRGGGGPREAQRRHHHPDTPVGLGRRGEGGRPGAARSGLPQGRGGRLSVQPDLTVAGFPRVYAVGDVANIPYGDEAALPQLGSVAQQAGDWAAQNILAGMAGRRARRRSTTGTRASWR